MAIESLRRDVDRRGAWLVLVLALVVWAGLAALLVPWERLPGRLDAVPAADYFTPGEIDRAETYAGAVRRWADLALALGLVAALVLGWTRWGRRAAAPLTRPRWWVAVPLLVLVFEVIVWVVRLPSAWQIRELRLEEGLTTQAAAGWWVDQALALLVSWVATTLVVVLVVGCARRWPRRWYLPASAVVVAATYLVSLAYPLVVEPLFNRFTPLSDSTLRTELVTMAERQGVDVGEVLVADASRRTTTLNAYVSGLGGTKRLVLYDTLLEDAPDDEVIAVAAHEVAHAARHDVLVGTTLGAVGAVAGIAALALLLDGRRGRRSTGGLAEPTCVWPLLATVTVAAVLVSPVQNTVSRAIETRADLDALATTRDTPAFRGLHVRLAQRSLADPTPPAWRQLWWGSHPTVLERLALSAGGLDQPR